MYNGNAAVGLFPLHTRASFQAVAGSTSCSLADDLRKCMNFREIYRGWNLTIKRDLVGEFHIPLCHLNFNNILFSDFQDLI